MSTVFVSNMAAEHDYSSALQYGALRPITSGNYPIYKTSRLIEEIASALAESSSDDHLLISGSSVVAALCAVVWLMYHNKVNILLWDRGNGCYVERVIDKDSLRITIEQLVDRREGRVPEHLRH